GSATSSAEAQKRAAAYRLEERSSEAPEGGRIEEIFYRVGEYVTPGQPVVSILPPRGLKVRFFVPEAELPEISIGKTVRVKADGLASPVDASVSFISHDAEFTPPVIYSRDTRGKLVFLIEADLPQEAGFHPGLPVEVDW
ncbi:HlyD family secretion protein, partial [Henriciella aquimarina]|uniref:HlyD family secretion protein n=1 Tax=Henriciella aquimarina TaxID=545261 RepID=UPI00117ABD93